MRLIEYWRRAAIYRSIRSIPEQWGGLSVADGVRAGPKALWHRVVAENLFFGVQYVTESSVEGDIAEFGCATGRTPRVIAGAMKLMSSAKSLHLFDSFEGLPASTSQEDLGNAHVKTGVWAAGQCRGVSQGRLREFCRRHLPGERIKIYAGWYSETLSRIPAGTKFAMMHIDCDLYLSAFEVLNCLFKEKRVAEGAIILFDDWDCNHASNEHGERKAWRDVCANHRIVSSDLGGYGWAGHKFSVHSYTPGAP